jgi:hypothetical protein
MRGYEITIMGFGGERQSFIFLFSIYNKFLILFLIFRYIISKKIVSGIFFLRVKFLWIRHSPLKAKR